MCKLCPLPEFWGGLSEFARLAWNSYCQRFNGLRADYGVAAPPIRLPRARAERLTRLWSAIHDELVKLRREELEAKGKR